MLISYKDFKRSDGEIDWKAYNAAKVANGDVCYTCGGGILFGKGSPALCHDCKALVEDPEEVSHDSYIRCPKCKHFWDPSDGGDSYRHYEDGDHEMTCPECSEDFTIITHVSYSFVSPKLISEESLNEETAQEELL